jgi:predicted transcriptional regulator
MKSVLISIQPKWCELIASGEKTVEVRKTKPKIEPPFKCYIYCTKDKEKLWVSRGSERAFTREKIAAICQAKDVGGAYQGNGKVIGEFLCDVVITAEHGRYVVLNAHDTRIENLDLCDYADGKTVYGWNISELVIYDQPKKLSEFRAHDVRTYTDEKGYPMPTHEMTRPPQSWCYVEEGGAE